MVEQKYGNKKQCALEETECSSVKNGNEASYMKMKTRNAMMNNGQYTYIISKWSAHFPSFLKLYGW